MSNDSNGDWEVISPKSKGGASRYGRMWREVPAISIHKTGLSFNPQASAAWLDRASQVLVHSSQSLRQLSLKIIPRGEEVPDAYGLREKSKKGMTRHLAVLEIARRFPDCVGQAYRAQMTTGGTILVELSPTNLIKP